MYFVRRQALLVDDDYLMALVVDRPPGGAFRHITASVTSQPLSPYTANQRTSCPTVVTVPGCPGRMATRADLPSVITFLEREGYSTELGGLGATVLVVTVP